MLPFNQFLKEASTEGKNSHMTHVTDLVLYGGVDGCRRAILTLRSLRDMLAGNSKGPIGVTMKWDGAPSLICGIDPTDGEFFVAKKGIFNKNPVVYKTDKEIDADTSGDLALKLKIALAELSQLGIKGILQGDIMFTGKDVKTEMIDGEKYVTFHPNTIVYAVPAESDIGHKIASANLGIVFHTSYTGKDFASLKASYSVNLSGLKQTHSVWFQDASIHDLSGTATLTKEETAEVTAALSRAGKIFQKISSTTLKEIEDDPELARMLETFNNSLVRKGRAITDPAGHVENLIDWVKEKFGKEAAEKKTEKGKASVDARMQERLAFFSDANKLNLFLIYELQNAIDEAKLLLLDKLDTLSGISTFVKTADGFKVTRQEGFVAIDHLSGGAVKIVDRMNFSAANFSPDILKGWQR